MSAPTDAPPVCPRHPKVTLDADGCWACNDEAMSDPYEEREERVYRLFPSLEDDER